MQSVRRALYVLILIVSFVVLALPAFAQQVIATIPVGSRPYTEAINPVTNKIYIANACGNDFGTTCAYPFSPGTVTVVDGTTLNTQLVNVGYLPYGVAVNPVTNKIYIANQCGDDSACAGNGTVTVIDGATLATTTVTVESNPYGVAVNSVTNKIYAVNGCGTDLSCLTYSGTVSVIDGVSNTVTATVTVGSSPDFPVVNSLTNKIYVGNSCGNDPACAQPYSPGTLTVIDGATNNPTSVNVGFYPYAVDVNTVTNKIYVANQCGDDAYCGSTATMTVIDGASLATTDVAIGGYYPYAIAVNSATNKIYVPTECYSDVSCQGASNGTVSAIDGATLTYTSVPAGGYPYAVAVNSGTNKIYVVNQCGSDPTCLSVGTVTVIDGATLVFANIGVGSLPNAVAVNSATNRIYVPNICGNDVYCNTFNGTVSVIDGTSPTALQFVPLPSPCRAVDTRPERGGGGPIQGGVPQNFAISGAGSCATLPSAAAYSMNVSVVPQGPLGYLTVWPAGQPRPLASTLNSLDGRIKANAAIIPAGASGEISVYATSTTNVIVDVNGYFAPVSGSTLAFYPLPPCRVADTRHDTYPPGLGPPFLNAGQERAFPILDAATCNIPSSGVAAYSLNFSVVPHGSLFYMTVWPTGGPRPTVSTLNDIPGQIIANAAIVTAGASGEVSVYPTNDTDLVIDINGYFAAAGMGGLSLYGVTPCRVIDTRTAGGAFNGLLSPPVDVVDAGCAASSLAQAYVFNASVVPVGALGYLTLWPDGASQPLVSTLNALDASISSNMAIVPTGLTHHKYVAAVTSNGSVDAYASGLTQLILDISSYFAP
jgi:YVTN family beta-propeller protein